MMRSIGSVVRGAVAALAGVLFLASSLPAQAQDNAPAWEMRVCSDPNNLPYSNKKEEGFENRIAEILADELGAKLTYVWFPQRMALVRHVLREGECDLLIGVADGQSQVLTTLPYYRSSYVFVYPEKSPFEIESFDDPDLKKLTIGVELAGEGQMPPNVALANRGLQTNMVGYSVFGDYSQESPLSAIVTAVAKGDVDVAVAWGPVAGYFAKKQNVALRIVPVSPQFEPPFLPMVFSIAIGLRHGDRDFERLLDRALVSRWDDIQAVLKDYGVPLLPLPKPKLSLGGS